jgi:alpha-tubulin suppressor-like RCC1 family protein
VDQRDRRLQRDLRDRRRRQPVVLGRGRSRPARHRRGRRRRRTDAGHAGDGLHPGRARLRAGCRPRLRDLATTGLWCWGANDYGEIGDGTFTSALAPVQVVLPAVATSVAALATSTCATTDDKRLWCWGRGDLGQLGDPALVAATTPAPTAASGLDGWTTVAAAEQMACAQRDDEMWCWGAINSGNGLGGGVWNVTRGFGRIATGVAAITVGENTLIDDLGTDTGDLDLACALQAGRVACFGDNRFGQLGQGAASMAPAPVRVGATWTGLAVGGSHACALDDDQLYCWGSTQAGQANGIASGTSTNPCGANPDVLCDVWTPTRLEAVDHVQTVALGAAHSCALDRDALVCWGSDEVGQLGAPSLPPAPTQVAGAWTALLETHGNAACATAGGEVSCWGAMLGALATPTRFVELDAARTIGVSASIGSPAGFGCFLDTAGALSCIGANTLGQFGNGATGFCGDTVCNNNETSTSCPGECGTAPVTTLGRSYAVLSVGWGGNSSGGPTCAITTTGTVECWGRNRGAMITTLIDPATQRPPDNVFVPTPIAGLKSCTQIATGDAFACALCAGDILCWGDNRRGAMGNGRISAMPVSIPEKLAVTLDAGDGWAQLAAGSGFACARTTAGQVYCWGSNIHGALGTGAGNANVLTPVARSPAP